MSLYLGENLISGQATLVGESRNIGQIIPSTIPLTDAGLHLLDGALIQGGGIYSAFVTYMAGLVSTYPDLFTTEADWQTAVTTYGVCGKFVYDSTNNTVRLPKYNSKIYTGEGTAPVSIKGNGTAIGVTDGMNNFGLEVGIPHVDGYFLAAYAGAYGSSLPNTGAATGIISGPHNALGLTTDASKSGLIGIANLANITTSLDGYYYIVIATSTKTDIQVDIDEIATDLNSKADVDLTNVANTAGFRKLVEVYNNGTSWYKVYREYNPQNGNYIGLWCEQGGIITGAAVVNLTGSVTFLKPYYDTNYLIATQAARNNNDSAYINNQSYVYNKVNTGFTAVCYGDGTSTMIMWQACGYIR